MNDLTIGHLLVVVGVDHMKQVLNFFFPFDHVHANDEISEFLLINDSISITVCVLEELGEFE